VCVCVRERERERECVCVYVCEERTEEKKKILEHAPLVLI